MLGQEVFEPADSPNPARDLERNVLLIGDIPGVNVQTVLRPPATTFGAADLEIVTQRLPFEGFVSFDNQGSRYLGPYALSGGISEYGQLGMGEQIEARSSIGRYLRFYNGRRPHSSLGGRTPEQTYFDNLPQAVAA